MVKVDGKEIDEIKIIFEKSTVATSNCNCTNDWIEVYITLKQGLEMQQMNAICNDLNRQIDSLKKKVE